MLVMLMVGIVLIMTMMMMTVTKSGPFCLGRLGPDGGTDRRRSVAWGARAYWVQNQWVDAGDQTRLWAVGG